MLPHTVYDSPVFATLKPVDIAVLLLLIRKHTGHNNGAISLGVREIAMRCRCGQATALRSLAKLRQAGVITATYKGHLVPEVGRSDAASRWRLNFVSDTPKSTRLLNSENSRCRASKMEHRGASVAEHH